MRQKCIQINSKKSHILILLILWTCTSNLRFAVGSGIDAKAYMHGHNIDYLPRINNLANTARSDDDFNTNDRNFGIRRRASTRDYAAAAASSNINKIGSNSGVGGINANSHNPANVVGVVGGKASAANDGTVNGMNAVGSVNSGGEVMLPKSFPMSAQEPTCEQLRAMWIFSKRQSRAAEMTNEIPTYRDPFAYNIWEPYYSTTRSLGAVRMVPRYSDRSRSPVFGRVVSREPLFSERLAAYENQQHQRPQRPLTDNGKNYRIHNTGVRRPTSQYRYVGTNGGAATNPAAPTGATNPNAVAAVQGSFQKLKELIWTERAKDLTQQRRDEELAARAAVLKEIANGKNIQSSAAAYKHPFKLESAYMDENRSPDIEASSFQHDGRYNLKNNNKNSAFSTAKLPAITRSYAVNDGGSSSGGGSVYNKPSTIFGGSAAGRLMLSNLNNYQGQGSDENHNINVGVHKTYPMRSSHFRERNRAIFKQHSSPTEYFQRNTRNRNKVLPIGGDGFWKELHDKVDLDLNPIPQQSIDSYINQYPYPYPYPLFMTDGQQYPATAALFDVENNYHTKHIQNENENDNVLLDLNNIYEGDKIYNMDSGESLDENYED